MTSNDMVNIETAIAVRDLFGASWESHAGVPVVTRVFDRALGRTIARRFGFENVQSTEELTAPWFVGAALGLDVLGSFSVGAADVHGQPADGRAGQRACRAGDERAVREHQGGRADRHSTGVMEHPLRRGNPVRGGRPGVPGRAVRGTAGRAAAGRGCAEARVVEARRFC